MHIKYLATQGYFYISHGKLILFGYVCAAKQFTLLC